MLNAILRSGKEHMHLDVMPFISIELNDTTLYAEISRYPFSFSFSDTDADKYMSDMFDSIILSEIGSGTLDSFGS